MIMRPQVRLWVLFYLTATFDLSSQQGPEQGEMITFTELGAWKNGRPCFQVCLWGGNYRFAAPAAAIACSRNSCLCRPDLAPFVYRQLTSCMDGECGNEIEKESAVDFFSGYCKAYYATAPPPPTLRSTTPATVKAETTTAAIVTQQEVSVSVSVTVTQKQATVTQTLKPDATTMITFISSKSTASTSLQSEWTHLYVALFAILATSIRI